VCRREKLYGDRLGKDSRVGNDGEKWMRRVRNSSWEGEQWIVAQEMEGK
jgi:hypothetical protein